MGRIYVTQPTCNRLIAGLGRQWKLQGTMSPVFNQIPFLMYAQGIYLYNTAMWFKCTL